MFYQIEIVDIFLFIYKIVFRNIGWPNRFLGSDSVHTRSLMLSNHIFERHKNKKYIWYFLFILIGNNSLVALSEPNQSVRCPRFSPSGEYLIWLQNRTGGPHGQCVSLVGLNWPLNDQKPKTIVPIVDTPDPEDKFPGQFFIKRLNYVHGMHNFDLNELQNLD